MKNILCFLLFLLLSVLVIPAKANNTVPPDAQKFADESFLGIVKQHLHSSSAEDFNLNPGSENITFGSLIPVHKLTKEFILDPSTPASEGIIPSGEYISVVYQDGKPVNVIGTYKKQNDAFELSTFGYGKEIAVALDQLSSNENILYERPMDNWYRLNERSVTPISGPIKHEFSTKIDVNDFKRIINGIYIEKGYVEEEESQNEIKIISSLILLSLFSLGIFSRRRLQLRRN